MKVADAVAAILKAEGVDYLFAYPVNHLIEAAAKVDIRTIIVRQERIGLHMADAIGRLSSGAKVGVFAMQHGPGAENDKGPRGPLVRCCWIRCRRASMRTARARLPQSKKASGEALRRLRKADSGPGARRPGGRHGGPYGPAEPLDYRAAPRPLQAASRRRGPQRQTARPEGRAACGVVVAGAGFEPATFGL